MPYENFVNITKSDSVIIDQNIQALYVQVAGNLVIDSLNGVKDLTIGVLQGDIVPFRPKRIKAATTATVIGLH